MAVKFHNSAFKFHERQIPDRVPRTDDCHAEIADLTGHWQRGDLLFLTLHLIDKPPWVRNIRAIKFNDSVLRNRRRHGR